MNFKRVLYFLMILSISFIGCDNSFNPIEEINNDSDTIEETEETEAEETEYYSNFEMLEKTTGDKIVVTQGTLDYWDLGFGYNSTSGSNNDFAFKNEDLTGYKRNYDNPYSSYIFYIDSSEDYERFLNSIKGYSFTEEYKQGDFREGYNIMVKLFLYEESIISLDNQLAYNSKAMERAFHPGIYKQHYGDSYASDVVVGSMACFIMEMSPECNLQPIENIEIGFDLTFLVDIEILYYSDLTEKEKEIYDSVKLYSITSYYNNSGLIQDSENVQNLNFDKRALDSVRFTVESPDFKPRILKKIYTSYPAFSDNYDHNILILNGWRDLRDRIFDNRSEALEVRDFDFFNKSGEVIMELDDIINTLDVHGDILLVPLPKDEDYADFLTYSP